ncbi:GTPase HflX [Cetobacterium sp. 8H]|uniref:GTPase HflX n=1 Tax=Cetobacterium sp. 8H TaxID=2759681 RepID=UPI00163C5976|nr:GTPase HflX [Cetobacterium sp. 8H]MBC2851487.1 GTPase HflX [Cetobacterium sp. 8H]
MIKGNVEGVRDSILAELGNIYDMSVEKGRLVSPEIVALISDVTRLINREISVSIDRKGRILEVAIGDSNSVELPILDLSNKKLSGVKVIHTHPSGYSKLSMIDISALLKLKLDAILAVGVGETDITGVNIGYCKVQNQELTYEELENLPLEKAINVDYLEKVQEIETELRKNDVVEDESEYAILVGVDSDESLDELEELAKACEVNVSGRILQRIKRIDNVFYIGSGKVRELAILRQIKNANLIIFDEELSGVQIKNLEAVTGCKVIDRTILILEIFARRARTREARIQVELAQLKYRSQRLIGLGSIMSRTGGGIGTKGPGEKKLEIDRRRIKDDIHALRQELEKIKKIRALQRTKRESSGIPRVSLVGYTNVGKSTLRNLLVDLYPSDNTVKKEAVFAENMLFATLDATTRTMVLPDKRIAALTDTVGFVRKLPHDLVEAFKSTLEEVVFSDLLVHLVDASSDTVVEQIKSVENVLSELGAGDKPTILALNKCDVATEEQISKLKELYSGMEIVEISAKNEVNIDILMEKVIEHLPRTMKKVEFLIPYSESSVNAYLHRNAIIEEESYEADGTKFIATISDEVYNRYNKFIVQEF